MKEGSSPVNVQAEAIMGRAPSTAVRNAPEDDVRG